MGSLSPNTGKLTCFGVCTIIYDRIIKYSANVKGKDYVKKIKTGDKKKKSREGEEKRVGTEFLHFFDFNMLFWDFGI